MKILNLDSYAAVKRQVTLAGVSHNVEELSVQQFIDNLAAAEELEAEAAKGDMPIGRGMQLSVEQAKKAVPTLSEDVLRALKMSQMAALLQFIRGELDPDAGPASAVASDPDAPEGAEAKKA